jgi:hypothetical protein
MGPIHALLVLFLAAHDVAAVAAHAVEFLNAEPDATADALVQEVERLDADDLNVTAVQLTGGAHAAYAVSAAFPSGGSFFVVARDHTGRFAVRWNVKDVAARRQSPNDEIGQWSRTEVSWGHGPLRGEIGRLPASRTGRSRFYVDAEGAAPAGGTWNKQLSIWEWNGQEAMPLLARAYSVSVDTGQVVLDGETLVIPTKDGYKTFHSCGQCPEPEVLWRVQVTPDGVRDLGKEHVTPELQVVDELFDRVLRGKRSSDIASASAAVALRKVIDELDLPKEAPLGMLSHWQITKTNGQHVLEFATDNLPCRMLQFVMNGRYVVETKVVNRCNSPSVTGAFSLRSITALTSSSARASISYARTARSQAQSVSGVT